MSHDGSKSTTESPGANSAGPPDHGTTYTTRARSFRPTGTDALLKTLYGTVRGIDVLWKLNPWGANASYDRIWNGIRIQRNPTVLTLIHEAVHALDRKSAWHITPWWDSPDDAEGLAYATEWMLNVADPAPPPIGGFPSVEAAPSAAVAVNRWNGIWKSFNGLGQQVFVGFGSRPLSLTDVYDADAKLGLSFSCFALKPIYEKYLLSRGIKVCLPCMGDQASVVRTWLPPFI